MSAEAGSVDRSADTRLRLIEAALELFGAQGFEGTTTRQLAERAKVNLAAIPYHFGSKEKLYQAVAGHIGETIQARVLASIGNLDMPPDGVTPQAARRALHRMIERAALVLMSAESESFARFVLRELMAPTTAFEIFYQGVVEPAQTQICTLIAAATGHKPDAQDLRIQGIMLFGQIAIFRFALPAVRRRLDIKSIGTSERDRIKRMLRFNLDAILDAGGCP